MINAMGEMLQKEFKDGHLSGIGGIETAYDVIDAIDLGRANTIQVCTGVQKFGYDIVQPMIGGVLAYMDQHKIATIEEMRGHSARFIDTQTGLVERQQRKGSILVPATVGGNLVEQLGTLIGLAESH